MSEDSDSVPAEEVSGPTPDDVHRLRHLSRIFLWLNSGCNARCRMCDIWREPPGRHLSAADVAAWLPEWKRLSVARVVICGEPLLHPELMEICTRIRDQDIRVDILTNGLLLKRHARDLARACDALAVSLDGPPAIHNEIRGRPFAFERLREGVAAMRTEAPGLGIDARCAIHGRNFRAMRATVLTAKSLGVRSISFSGTDLHNEIAFRREGRVTNEYAASLTISEAELDDLESELASLERENADDFRSGFISDSPQRLHRIILDYYAGLVGRSAMPRPRCTAPWTSVVIEYDGTVRPCFPMEPYGNLLAAGGLDAVVNADATVRRRRGISVATDPTCLNCVCQSDITPEVTDRWANDRARPAIAQLTAVTDR